MGAGNSQFTSEQAKEISQMMKVEYELCRKRGVEGQEEQEILLQKYQTIVEQITNPSLSLASSYLGSPGSPSLASPGSPSPSSPAPVVYRSPSSLAQPAAPSSLAQPKAVVANARRLSRGYSKDEHGIQPKNTRTRRRSFDNKPVPNNSKKNKDMTQSNSVPSLEAKVLEEPPQQGLFHSLSLCLFSCSHLSLV